jgi:hypothetical protein
MGVSGKLHAPADLPPGKNPCIKWIGGCVGPEYNIKITNGVLHNVVHEFTKGVLRNSVLSFIKNGNKI